MWEPILNETRYPLYLRYLQKALEITGWKNIHIWDVDSCYDAFYLRVKNITMEVWLAVGQDEKEDKLDNASSPVNSGET